MRRIFSILAVCLLAIQYTHADDCDDNPSATGYQLCQDFRDIRNLIDPNTLAYYITYGYFRDDNFRTAMKYIESDSFEQISDQIANSAPYKALLKRFSDAGVDTTTISSISNIFKCLLLGKAKYTDVVDDLDSLERQSIIVPRTLTDIATNLKKSLSKEKVRSLIKEKLEDGGDFAKFYKVARSRKFRSEATKLFSSTQLRNSLTVLTRNKIDLKKLAKLAAEILDWGPKK